MNVAVTHQDGAGSAIAVLWTCLGRQCWWWCYSLTGSHQWGDASLMTWRPVDRGRRLPESAPSPRISSFLDCSFSEKLVLEVYRFTLCRLLRWNSSVETPWDSLVLASWWIELGAEFFTWGSWREGSLNNMCTFRFGGECLEFLRFSRRFSDLMLRRPAMGKWSRSRFRISSGPQMDLLLVINLKPSKPQSNERGNTFPRNLFSDLLQGF